MTDLYIFEYSHPKDPVWPDFVEGYFDQCAFFSGEILKHRTESEIALTMRDIDLHTNENYQFEIDSLHCVDSEHRMTKENFGSVTGRAGFISLFWLYKKNDKSPFLNIKNPTWAEIFSIYTLGLIAYLNRDISRMREDSILSGCDYLAEVTTMYMAEAMEASTIADFIYKDYSPVSKLENTIYSLKESKANNASKGGKARSKKFNDLKEIVLNEYSNNHSHKNNRQAARDLLRTIPDNEKCDPDGNPILVEHNAIEQVARWIGEFKRKNLH